MHEGGCSQRSFDQRPSLSTAWLNGEASVRSRWCPFLPKAHFHWASEALAYFFFSSSTVIPSTFATARSWPSLGVFRMRYLLSAGSRTAMTELPPPSRL